MHNLTVREIIFGVSTRAAVVCGVLARLRQAGRSKGCLAGRGALQGDLLLWALPPRWSGSTMRASDPCTHVFFQGKGVGAREGGCCLACCGVGVCCTRHARVPCFITELLKSTGRCVPSCPCDPFPLKSASPSSKSWGHRAAATASSWVPPLCCAGPCKELMGMEWEKGPLHPGSPHPAGPREGSAQHLYPAGRCEALAQQGTAHEMS